MHNTHQGEGGNSVRYGAGGAGFSLASPALYPPPGRIFCRSSPPHSQRSKPSSPSVLEVGPNALWSFFCYTPPICMLRNVKFMISSRPCFMIRQIMCHVRKLISKEEHPDPRKILGFGLRVNFGCISSMRHHHFPNLYSYI